MFFIGNHEVSAKYVCSHNGRFKKNTWRGQSQLYLKEKIDTWTVTLNLGTNTENHESITSTQSVRKETSDPDDKRAKLKQNISVHTILHYFPKIYVSYDTFYLKRF